MNRSTRIIVPNWDKFQHYKDRTPPWIKLYLELQRKPEWCDLTYAERGCLVTIWMTYADHKCRLTVGNLTIGGKLRRTYGHLETLNHAGFIELRASTRSNREESGASAPGETATTPDPVIVQQLHEQIAAWAASGS